MASVHERLVEARPALTDAGIDADEAALDAEVLARHVLGWDRAQPRRPLRASPRPPASTDAFDALVARRAAREPVAYIIGAPRVLGPRLRGHARRPDPAPGNRAHRRRSARAVSRRASDAVRHVIDVGTGSGCLAVALAREFRRRDVIATDISAAALAVARAERRAARRRRPHHVRRRRPARRTSTEPVDLIVSNPPYVPAGDAPTLQPEVRGYEPAVALFGGDATGCDVSGGSLASAPRRGLRRAAGSSSNSASVRTRRVARWPREQAGWDVARIRSDLQGIPRVAGAQEVRRGGLSVLQDRRGRDSRDDRLPGRSASSPSRTSTRRRRCTCSSSRAGTSPRLNDLARRRRCARRRDGAARPPPSQATGLRGARVTARCSTATPTRARRCSTSTCTCSADDAGWPPG